MELDGLQSVASAVDRLVTTYQDGRKLVDEIKERRRARDAAQARPAVEGPDDIFSQDLEEALLRAKDGIQSRYDRDFKRHGEEFATGDSKYLPYCLLESTGIVLAFSLPQVPTYLCDTAC